MVVWLCGCWVVGLLGCWVVGLLGCLVVLLSKICPKSVPKGSQNGPKSVPNGSQKGSPEGLMTLGALGALLGIFVHGILVLLGRFGCHFGASGIQRGSQNRAFGDKIGTRGSKMVFRREVQKTFEN